MSISATIFFSDVGYEFHCLEESFNLLFKGCMKIGLLGWMEKKKVLVSTGLCRKRCAFLLSFAGSEAIK